MAVNFDFAGKRALVTGAGKGIGRDIVVALHNSGAHVIAVTRTAADLDSLKKELDEDRLTCQLLDLAKDNDGVVQTVAAWSALQACLPVDLLVNNAGVAICEPLLDVTADGFNTTININLRGPLLATQVAAKDMVARGVKGSIVNVSSICSTTALPELGAYSMSKAALDMLTKCTALELGPKGIRCNSVNPTVIMTALGREAWKDENKARPMLGRHAMGRFGEVEEVTSAVLYLLSDGPGLTTGSALFVDGGFTSTCPL